MITATWRRLRRMWRILCWGSAAFRRIEEPSQSEPRLLVVYDLGSQPLSVGDILVFQEASLVLRERYGLHAVDFALAYDPAHPVVDDPAFAHLDPDSFLFHLSTFLPVAQVNPFLGSVLLFDDRAGLEKYVADNADRYRVWPSLAQYASREYLFYDCFNRLFREHFIRTGTLPTLRSRPAPAAWARAFIATHAGPRLAVSVQLRRNLENPARDSDYGSWLEFFRICAERYSAMFFIVCAQREVDSRFRLLANTVLAKDHGTTVEQDLALIDAARLHMGAASGPGTMAQFSHKPYCMFNMVMDTASVGGFVREDHRNRFYFSAPSQSWIEGRETPELLLAEFERLWAAAGNRVAAAT